MSFYRQQLLPRLVDRACGSAGYDRWRREVTAGLAGTVVEIGFGSGLNMPAYPAAVTRVWAVEPASLGRKLAAARIADSHVHVEHVGLRGEALPLEDDSCDGALSTFTLCTIPDVERALAEVRRIKGEFWSDLRVDPGDEEFNQSLEYANRVSDFLEMADLMIQDAARREESCGGHFREEHQTDDGEALRDDEHFAKVTAWEYGGDDPVPHDEDLNFEEVKLATRSYK